MPTRPTTSNLPLVGTKKAPRGRFGRLARMARVGASAVLRRDGEAVAQRAAETLGQLRGVAAKVGQMAAYVDGVVPEKHRESYERWLKGLLDATPASPPEAIRARVEEELGGPLDRLFASFEDTPFASASIGQVHGAVLPDGQEVAVKVQHPGIDEALESDLKNAGLLESIAGVAGGRKIGSDQGLKEIRERFREELDYGLEARRQRAFIELHRGDPVIRIPRVIDDHSTSRVLTMERVSGMSLDAARGATEDLRRGWAEALWRFVFKGTLVGGMFNADPHPGNYFFVDDGTVWFLDFGCVQPVTEAKRRVARAMHRAAVDGDEDGFAVGVRDMLGLVPGEHEQAAVAYVRHAFSPLFEAPYRITRSFVAESVDGMRDLAVGGLRGREGFRPMPPDMLFMNRLQFGFYSVLARLDVAVDYGAVERGFLPPE